MRTLSSSKNRCFTKSLLFVITVLSQDVKGSMVSSLRIQRRFPSQALHRREGIDRTSFRTCDRGGKTMLVSEIQKVRLSSGDEVAVRTAGDASKPALVLLHGFPNSSRMFRNVIGPLSDSVYVVAPDLPGFGASDPPSEPSFDRLASS